MLALGKLGFVRRENQRQVRKLRHILTESLVKQNLFMRVRQMVLTANDVRDAHFDVVEDDRKIVERVAVRTQQHQIFNLSKRALLLAINNIRKSRRAFARHL